MRVEFRPVTDDIEAVAPWTSVVAAELLEHWKSSHPFQVRTLVAALEEDGTPVAVGLEVHRPMTAYAKLLPVYAATPRAEAALVAAVEERAFAAGAAAVKREVPASLRGSAAWDEALAAGYVAPEVPATGAPVLAEAGSVPAGLIRFAGAGPRAGLPYYRQTTDFTCGPVSAHVALTALGLLPEPSREEELRLWREATTTDGCDPLGLALAAKARGAEVEVHLSTEEPILLEIAADENNRNLRRFIQEGFRERVLAEGIELKTHAFSLEDLDAALDSGAVAAVLIEELGMHAESCPHWIAVHSREGEVYYAQDPWTDADESESWLDGHALPLPRTSLDRLAWYGKPAVRSMVVLRAPRA
ncbi:MAG: peptidase C39 family protein [Arthrobacter sp.]|jgi:hypothetical protein|nr:peptidase C39 family protein [Arthrobacter sp.]